MSVLLLLTCTFCLATTTKSRSGVAVAFLEAFCGNVALMHACSFALALHIHICECMHVCVCVCSIAHLLFAFACGIYASVCDFISPRRSGARLTMSALTSNGRYNCSYVCVCVWCVSLYTLQSKRIPCSFRCHQRNSQKHTTCKFYCTHKHILTKAFSMIM